MPGGEDDENPGDTPSALTRWRVSTLEGERKDHEARISSLERWRGFVIGAATIVAVAVGAFAGQVWKAFSGH